MAEGKHGYVRSPAADVDVHPAIRLVDAHARADRGGHALIHRHDAANARVHQHIHQRLPLAGRHAAGQRQQQLGAERRALADHLAHKVAQHFAHQIETADSPVAQRPFHNQPRRGALYMRRASSPTATTFRVCLS